MPDLCVFTIASANYLHYADVLMDGVEKFAPGAERILVFCDAINVNRIPPRNYGILTVDLLDIPEFGDFIFKYSITEGNTAVKPYAFSHLLFQRGFKKVIFFDPDVCLYSSLQPMIGLLDSKEVLLTPHLNKPVDDPFKPSEQSIQHVGIYNLGFAGMRSSGNTRSLCTWWQGKVYRDCIIDRSRGLFFDQRPMDLVPGMFPNVHIERNPGWNVAYWNLRNRQVDFSAGKYLVDSLPLVFFHFSGIRFGEQRLSAHENLYTDLHMPRDLQRLLTEYLEKIGEKESLLGLGEQYGFGCLPDGEFVPDLVRSTYRRYRDAGMIELNIAAPEFKDRLVAELDKPALLNGASSDYVTRLAAEIYIARPDVRQAFPRLPYEKAQEYARWFISTVENAYGVSNEWTAPLRIRLAGIEMSIASSLQSKMLNRVFTTIENNNKLRHAIDKITTRKLRQRTRRFVMQRGR